MGAAEKASPGDAFVGTPVCSTVGVGHRKPVGLGVSPLPELSVAGGINVGADDNAPPSISRIGLPVGNAVGRAARIGVELVVIPVLLSVEVEGVDVGANENAPVELLVGRYLGQAIGV